MQNISFTLYLNYTGVNTEMISGACSSYASKNLTLAIVYQITSYSTTADFEGEGASHDIGRGRVRLTVLAAVSNSNLGLSGATYPIVNYLGSAPLEGYPRDANNRAERGRV